MERTGGEPDVIDHDEKKGEYIFCDCSAESPKGRRSVCYDREALESRKKHKPENNAIDMATAMGIEILTEEQYRELQKLENFDMKTSSWVQTGRFSSTDKSDKIYKSELLATFLFSCLHNIYSRKLNV